MAEELDPAVPLRVYLEARLAEVQRILDQRDIDAAHNEVPLREFVATETASLSQRITEGETRLREHVQAQVEQIRSAHEASRREATLALEAARRETGIIQDGNVASVRKAEAAVALRLDTMQALQTQVSQIIPSLVSRVELGDLIEKFDSRNSDNLQRQLTVLDEKSIMRSDSFRRELETWRAGLNERMALINQATDKTTEALNLRIGNLNDVRQEARDRESKFASLSALAALADRVDEVGDRQREYATLAVTNSLAVQVDDLERTRDREAGRRVVISAMISFGTALLVTVVGGVVLVAVRGHV